MKGSSSVRHVMADSLVSLGMVLLAALDKRYHQMYTHTIQTLAGKVDLLELRRVIDLWNSKYDT